MLLMVQEWPRWLNYGRWPDSTVHYIEAILEVKLEDWDVKYSDIDSHGLEMDIVRLS